MSVIEGGLFGTVADMPDTGTVASRTQFRVQDSPFGRGVSLVEASAGTGKTFNIAMSVIRLLLEEQEPGVPLVNGIGNILVVTFTVAATDELVSRIRTLLRQAHEVFNNRPSSASAATESLLRALAKDRWERARGRVAQAIAEVDTLAVFTIHGFCKRILDEFALESGTPFGASLLEDEQELLRSATQDWWRRRFYANPPLAAYAVRKQWAPEVFLADYRLWSRFPDVTIDPAVTFDGAKAELDAARAALAAVWHEAEFRELVAAVEWNKDAPCGSAESLDQVVRGVQAALTGDLGAAEEIGRSLCVEALQQKATKRSKAQKEKLQEIAGWPVAIAVTRLVQALDAFLQALRVDCLHSAKQWIAAEKRRRNVLGFDDLLEGLSRVLSEQGPQGLLAQAIRAQFQAALIDEFQDTDQHQFRIFATAFADRPLFLIGDPKQAIYAFRGADVHAYLAAVRTADPQFTLGENYRSTPQMVQAVNAVFAQRGRPFVEEAMPFTPARAAHNDAPPALLEGDHALHWLVVEPEVNGDKPSLTARRDAQPLIYAACLRHIARQLNDGWKPRHIAVLVRTSSEGREMAEALRAHGIPAVVSGLGNVMQSSDVDELQRLLEAIAAPRHEGRVRSALATHLWGGDARELLRLSSAGAEAEWEQVVLQLTAWRETWVTHGVLQVVQEIMAQRRVFERFMAFDDGDRRLTNLRHAMELVHEAAVHGSLNVEGVLRWLAARRADATREAEVSELRLETDADAVQVLTIHKSKGLQFELVYCPTLYRSFPTDGKQPLLVHEGDRIVFDHGSPRRAERLRQAEVERLAEDCRLVYVALTRARFRTYVGWGAVGSTTGQPRGAFDSALGYLLANVPALDEAPVSERPGMAATWYRDDCARYVEAVEACVARAGGLMHMERLRTVGVGERVLVAPAQPAPAFDARRLPTDVPLRTRFDTYTVSSFTALASGGHAARTTVVAADATRDVDDVRDAVTSATAGHLTHGTTTQQVRDLPASDFRTFPAGRRAGTLLHTLFEHSRFDDTVEVLRQRVALRLIRQQFATDEADPRIESVVHMMRAVFDAPLAPLPVTLAQVPVHKARHEWEFLLPFADATRAVSRHALAQQFELHGGAEGARYATRLRALGTGRLHGFLTGFVDLVFEHAGRWYVVDWKSNQLGADPAAYARDGLQEVMDAHHYTLQYHLYLVALHRFLRTRLADYDYDRHIGGAAYAFLRGFAPGASTSGHGWFTDRPSRALIEALSHLMDRAIPNDGALA